MKCWNCQNPSDEALVCGRCGMPQPVGSPPGPFEALGLAPRLRWEAGELQGVHEDLARRCHPDLFRAHRDDRVLSASKSAMRALNDAYRTVRDRDSRLIYILSALGQGQQSMRTVPEGLQDSAQILDRVLSRIEEARQKGDRAEWEAQQDHIASLQIKVEGARERSDHALRVLAGEWDAGLSAAGGEWPEIGEEWIARAVTLAGERAYLRTVGGRLAEAREWPDEDPAPA
ncbi:MAG: hypothetical protein FJY75_00255 [Candidatus Eisenbacteria bacterium]|uniref:Fe-S protein assembly co-chaperone HscB n=1 Tax=Eiseniibacteriota bacterium TaxID=2212470 RepID=A0A937XAB5_UNCEI|nr:hypothetical protein [Candidatus Eisenbacteria bacterium]